jgi:hypothetical protein
METKEKNQKISKVNVTLHTYRKGGSMICDEQKMEFASMLSDEDMERLVSVYKEGIKYEGDVFYNISGRIGV